MTKSRLFLVLKLIGWKDGASVTDQSQSKEKENLNNHGLLSTFNIEN